MKFRAFLAGFALAVSAGCASAQTFTYNLLDPTNVGNLVFDPVNKATYDGNKISFSQNLTSISSAVFSASVRNLAPVQATLSISYSISPEGYIGISSGYYGGSTQFNSYTPGASTYVYDVSSRVLFPTDFGNYYETTNITGRGAVVTEFTLTSSVALFGRYGEQGPALASSTVGAPLPALAGIPALAALGFAAFAATRRRFGVQR